VAEQRSAQAAARQLRHLRTMSVGGAVALGAARVRHDAETAALVAPFMTVT
jgi:hypothetical protein